MDLLQIARFVTVVALVLLVIAGALFLAAKTGIQLGRLPGDIIIKRDSFTCAVPLVSSLIFSIILTIVINLALALLKK